MKNRDKDGKLISHCQVNDINNDALEDQFFLIPHKSYPTLSDEQESDKQKHVY